jgi:putative membrane protein
MWWNDDWAAPWMLFGPVFPILFALTCMAVMFFAMRGMHAHGSGNALDILKERYARGEINQAEFDERRRSLGP